MELSITNGLPMANKDIELSLTSIPTSPSEIKELYHDNNVREQFDDFNKNTSISATVNDLLQAVDLIALAYQTSYNHGLKCAPTVAGVKVDYLDLVSESSTTILSFKQKCQDAIFKLSSAGIILNKLQKIEIIDVEKLNVHKGNLERHIAESKEAEGDDDFQYLYKMVNDIEKDLGIFKESELSLGAFPFKIYTKSAISKIEALISKADKNTDQISRYFAAGLNEIADCSRYASEMENDTEKLIQKTTAIYNTADKAFKECVEQDVTEKENQRKLQALIAEKKKRREELASRESQLEADIADVLQEEKRIEKKLEEASSRAFWSSIVGAVGSAIGAGLNAYATYQTGGLNQLGASERLKGKVDQADKEVESKKKELETAQKDETEAKEKLDKLQGEFDILESDLTDLQTELAEQESEIESLENDKDEKAAELEKLEENEDNEEKRKELKAAITSLESDINEAKSKLSELKKSEKKQEKLRDLKKKEVSRAKDNTEDKKRLASALGATLSDLSKSMEQFHETAKNELEALSNKEEGIVKERRALQKERRDVVSELAGIVVELKNADKANETLDQLINALRITSETMQKILVSFNRIKRFWSAIKDKCHALTEKATTVENSIKLARDSNQEDISGAIDDLCKVGLFQLVRAWAALSALNEATYEQMVLVTKEMEKTFEKSVDVQQLCDKLNMIFEKEKTKIDDSLKVEIESGAVERLN